MSSQSGNPTGSTFALYSESDLFSVTSITTTSEPVTFHLEYSDDVQTGLVLLSLLYYSTPESTFKAASEWCF